MQDANWNVTAIANARSTVQERYAYSAYGIPNFVGDAFNPQLSSSHNWTKLYSGYFHCCVCDIYYVRHRYYAPDAGVWLTRDPYRTQRANDLYQYCRARPILLGDPTGLKPLLPGCQLLSPFINSNTIDCLCGLADTLSLFPNANAVISLLDCI
jgi:RHS repeat-associated protein